MKKAIFILLSVTMILALFVGCAPKTEPESSKEPTPSAVGSYTEDRDITAEERDMFDKVIAGLDTTKTYEPLQVATQVVAGTNYRFKVAVDDNGTKYDAHIVIYQPLEGDPEFVSEEKIS